MIRRQELAHLNLNVRDIERSTRFCRELFGLALLHEYEGQMGKHPWERQVALNWPAPPISSR